ncbi:hypothetical protein FRB95_006717 [Tulasnella sp. JGI-2019a]|nr:hypothetical protein FRB95_006717 [Tulasnella sp. JGI-2019a]
MRSIDAVPTGDIESGKEQGIRSNDTRSELETTLLVDVIEARYAAINQDQLPVELRVKIFEYAVAFDGPLPPETYYPDLHTLAQVCKAWSNTVRNSPSLWRVLSNCGAAAALWHTALTRSASVPLTIYLNDQFTGFQPAHVTALMNNLARWESVTINLNVHIELSPLEVASDAPLLRHLNLSLRRPSETYLDLPRGWSPKIQHIGLDHVGFRHWDDCILAGLHTLVLCRLQSFVPSHRELLAILRYCPDLEDLGLYSMLCRSDGDSIETSKIQLLRLQSIALMDIDLPTMETLLSRIHAPLCHTFSCCHESEQPVGAVNARQTGSFFVSRIKHHLPNTETIEITIFPGSEIEVDLYHGVDRVAHNSLQLLTQLEVLRCLHHVLDTAQPPWPHKISLVLICGIRWDVSAFLSNSRRVQRITFGAFRAPVLSAVLHDLSKARNGGGHSKWRFPALKDISIWNNDSTPDSAVVAKALRLVVESRGRDAGNSAVAGCNDGSVLLKRLCVGGDCGMDHETWAAIVDILGDGATRLEDEPDQTME